MTEKTNRRQIVDRRPLRTSLATVVLLGQRLRANETVSAATFSLSFSAKWQQAKGVTR